MNEMKLVTKNMSEIKPSPYNPRNMSLSAMEGLEKSIDTFGYIDPIIWNKKTGNIVGGHQRYEIFKKQGKDKIKVIEVELDEKEEKALNVTLNNQSIQGEWDNGKLQSILEEIKDLNFFDDICLDVLNLEIKGLEDASENEIKIEKNVLKKEKYLPEEWAVLVYLKSEMEQKEYFEEMQKRGLQCKNMIF